MTKQTVGRTKARDRHSAARHEAARSSIFPLPPLVLALLLFAFTLLSYFPAWSGKPIWDDDAHLTKPDLRSLGGLVRIWTEPGATQQYYPLVHSIFWVEHRLWGEATLPYHLGNIFLHLIGALLLCKILHQLKVPGAWLAAAIFALHPVQVESVAWISELKNTLSGVFFFAAVWFYLRFDRSRHRGPYLLALALFIAGLLCKSVIATMPAVLLVIFWWKRGKVSLKRDLVPLVPFFVAGLGAGLFTAWVERHFIGARGETFDFSLLERCLIAGRAFWFYLGKLLWPANLIFVYPRWQVSASIWWQYLFPLAALLLLAIAFALRKRWRAPLAALLLFTGMLFPALGFFNVYPFIYSFVADHFQYLASSAVITLFAEAFTLLFDRLNLGAALRYSCACTLLALLAISTWCQARIYRDPETLYQTTLQQNPACWMAENNLSAIFDDQNRLPDATAHAERALQLRPNYAEAHVNLGNIFLKEEKPDEAISHYRQALEIEPGLAKIHNNFGNALRLKGQFKEAIEQYQKTIDLDPRDMAAKNNLAWVLATCPDNSLRDGVRAVDLATGAARLSQGTNAIVLHTLAAAYAQNGQFAEAVKTAQRALQLASSQGNAELSQALRQEIALYQTGSPYREKSE